jgi:hypothetical protein
VNIKSLLLTLLPLAALPLAHSNPTDITFCNGGTATFAPTSGFGNWDANAACNWLCGDISSYNTYCGSSQYSPPDLTGCTGLQDGGGCNSLTVDVTGCDYICLDWGGPNGGCVQAYYVGDCSGNYTFCTPDDCNLSSYCCYRNCVPEGGSTGLMLGAALGGLGMFAMIRRFKP